MGTGFSGCDSDELDFRGAVNHEEDRGRQLGYAGVRTPRVRCKLQGGVRHQGWGRWETRDSLKQGCQGSEAEDSRGCTEETGLG